MPSKRCHGKSNCWKNNGKIAKSQLFFSPLSSFLPSFLPFFLPFFHFQFFFHSLSLFFSFQIIIIIITIVIIIIIIIVIIIRFIRIGIIWLIELPLAYARFSTPRALFPRAPVSLRFHRYSIQGVSFTFIFKFTLL